MLGVVFFLMLRRPPRSQRADSLFPYTTLFRSVRVSGVIAAEQEGCPADQRDSADACEQGLLPLRDLVVEVAPANLTSAFRGGAGFSCFRGLGNRIGGRLVCVCHYSSPPLRKTRKALVTPPGARTSRP